MTRARRQASQPPSPPPRLRLEQPRALVETRLNDLIRRGLELAEKEVAPYERDEFDAFRDEKRRWVNFADEVLRAAYNSEQPQQEFHSAADPPSIIGPPDDRAVWLDYERRDVRRGVNELRSLVERLDVLDAPSGGRAPRTESALASREVFVVHGRDEGLREQVARTLERLDFHPLILAEQPHEGRTLIEKFEANALDVGFAVVLLTPDDWGRGPDEAEFPAEPNRPRQNVILELGYFMGKLGRARVAALYKPGTELPTDIHGLGYIEIDTGGAWRFKLAAELGAAGYDVDLNQLR